MWMELAAAAYLAADWIYRKNNPDVHDGKDRPWDFVEVPRVDAGTPHPLIYGRCRVDAPVLADLRLVNVVGGDDPVVLVDMLFNVGIGMNDGNGTTRLHGMWSGDKRLPSSGSAIIGDLTGDGDTDDEGEQDWNQTGDGGPEQTIVIDGYGRVETLNGNPNQVLANDGDTEAGGAQPAPTWAGRRLLQTHSSAARTHAEIPGYRRYLSAFLFEIGDGSGWSIGNEGSIPPYSFEASSYVTDDGYPGVGIYGRIGQDSNPANVIWDLLKAAFGKIGLDASLYLDTDSFTAAATTLYQESHGYSLAIEQSANLGQHLVAILEQIGGVMYEEPSTGKIHLDLVRADFDPNTIPHITRENATDLNITIGTWRDIPNAIRLVYRNRDDDYKEASEVAMNQANAVGQDGERRWLVVQMPGITYASLAKSLVARLLAERSRPLMKCSIKLDRSFIRLRPGMVVKMTWSRPDVAGLVFRVMNVNLGTLSNGYVQVDLIQDVNYLWRRQAPKAPHYGVPGIKDLGLR